MSRSWMAGATAAIALLATLSIAHPGTGIVRDSRGNVYYTDLARVWKLAPSGDRTIAVQNVHTHELYLDSLDNLYGEHLWYEGTRTDRWGHRVWRLSPDGHLTDIVSARAGFRDDHDLFHFDWDRRGRMYWFDRGERTTLRRREANGLVSTLLVDIRDAGRMTVMPDGVVYFLEGADLRRLDDRGAVTTVARVLGTFRDGKRVDRAGEGIMGLWAGPRGDVFLADFRSRRVKRVDGHGRIDDVVQCDAPWGPTGGLIDPSGVMWVLQTNDANAVRLQLWSAGRLLRTYGP